MTWIRRKLIHWCLKEFYGLEFETSKLTPKQRMVAYKDAYGIENFRTILDKHIVSFIKKAGLTSPTEEEIWFNRGAIFFGQMLTNNMRRAHEEYAKMQEELANK